jgi:hypothetical protein
VFYDGDTYIALPGEIFGFLIKCSRGLLAILLYGLYQARLLGSILKDNIPRTKKINE